MGDLEEGLNFLTIAFGVFFVLTAVQVVLLVLRVLGVVHWSWWLVLLPGALLLALLAYAKLKK